MNFSAFRVAATAAVAVIALVLIAWQFGFLSSNGRNSRSMVAAKIGGTFELIDHNGKLRRSGEFREKFMLIYFGYSYCPDVCPTALQVMGSALNSLGEKAKMVQPIFITIDPKRDTVKHLKSYVQNFYPSLLGLTGTKGAIKDAAKKFRIYYAKVSGDKEKPDTDNYLVDHSSIVFFMGKSGQYITHFNHQTDPSKMAEIIGKQL